MSQVSLQKHQESGSIHSGDRPAPVGDLDRLLMALRQAMIIMIGAIEDYRGMERSIVPRRKRERSGE